MPTRSRPDDYDPEAQNPEAELTNPNAHSETSIDAPEMTEAGELDTEARSVKSATHALDMCKGTELSNKHRAMRTADVQAVYDGAPPNSSAQLQAHAQSWASNFSTQWLAGIVDPAVMAAQTAVVGSPLLTRSTLPRTRKDWKHKSAVFQSAASRLFRGWEGFSPLIANVAKENVLHGYTFTVWLDTIDWRPVYFRQESAFVPEEASQHAKDLQFFIAKQDYMLHEFIEMFSDEQAADSAGYHIENCVYAANHATVKNPREEALVTEFRRFADMITEGTLGLTYTRSGPRVVKTWLLWNREYDGSVSFWLLDRESGKLLRYSYKAYKAMTEVTTLFALQPGNGHIHSSKGIGRKLIANAVAIEKGRNNALDASRMAALLLLRVDPKDRAKLQTSIAAPFAVFDKSVEIDQQRFQNNADEFIKIDQLLSGWAQQAAGTYISAMVDSSGNRKTATEASIDATREQEQGNQLRARWLDQISTMVSQMQVRAFSDETLAAAEKVFEALTKGTPVPLDTAPEVVSLVEMFEAGLNAEDIKYLRSAPASGVVAVEENLANVGIAKVAEVYSGNPNVDQMELLKRNIEAMAGPEAVAALVIDNVDQTITSEAAAKQLSESATMYTLGVPSPVSPRDNHLVHGLTLRTLIASTFQSLSQDPVGNPKLDKAVELNLNHFADHLAAAAAAGQKDAPAFKELEAFHRQTLADFKQVMTIRAQTQASQAPAPVQEPAQPVQEPAQPAPAAPISPAAPTI